MNRPLPSRHARATLQLLILCGVLFLLLSSAFGYWQWQRYQNAIAAIDPRLARLEGLLAKQDELAKILTAARNGAIAHAYPATTDLSHAETDFQSQIRNLLQSAGINILATHQLPTEALEQIDLLSVEITANCTLPQLLQVLQQRAKLRPLARIDQLELQATRIMPPNAVEKEQTLSLKILFRTNHLRKEP